MQRPLPILVYHHISPAPARGAPFRSLYVHPRAFARQMASLKCLGYQGLSMTDLQPYLRGEKTGKVVGITFDDGYLSNFVHALPVLQYYGFSSTCYVVSQLLGASNQWDQSLGVPQVPLMTEAQLTQWVAGGQEVGAHTRHHVCLPQLDPILAQTEISLCKTELQALLQADVSHFCYPFGAYTDEHVQMVRLAGFETATTTQRGRCHPNSDSLQLARVPVLRTTSLLLFWLKIATAYEDRRRA